MGSGWDREMEGCRGNVGVAGNEVGGWVIEDLLYLDAVSVAKS